MSWLRRSWSRPVIALLLVLSGAGCASPAPTTPPAVTVHIVNGVSNVVVTSTDLLVADPASAAANGTVSYLAPCGGETDVKAPLGHASAGLLALMIDSSGSLDQLYSTKGTLEAGDITQFPLSIIWSNGELGDGEWIVVTPDGVTRSGAAPAAMPSGTCAAWPSPQE